MNLTNTKFKYFQGNIEFLEEGEVFVFGSNSDGVHGSGAARVAKDYFDAVYGIGVGFTGKCYAIPTKDHRILTMPLHNIKYYVDKFIEDAKVNPKKTFLVTQIGCGLAGFTPSKIAPMFKNAPENCIFDIVWKKYLE